jgi:hypothetical protein
MSASDDLHRLADLLAERNVGLVEYSMTRLVRHD